MTTVDTTAARPGLVATFRPLIPARAALRELTALPLIVGMFLGVIFGASSLYLVLKVGLTVSASIPVAVISLTLFRVFGKLGLRNRPPSSNTTSSRPRARRVSRSRSASA